MPNFERMFLLTLEDEEAWEALRKTFKDNPNVIVVRPDLDEVGRVKVEQDIKERSRKG